jgi:hypothetical protein
VLCFSASSDGNSLDACGVIHSAGNRSEQDADLLPSGMVIQMGAEVHDPLGNELRAHSAPREHVAMTFWGSIGGCHFWGQRAPGIQ